MINWKSPVVLTALVVGLLLVAAGGLILEQNAGDPLENLEEENGGQVDTSIWQTYENRELGFSFKYPKDWTVEKATDPFRKLFLLYPDGKQPLIEGGSTGDILIEVRSNQNHLSLKDFYDGKNQPNLYRDAINGVRQITVGGKQASRFSQVGGLQSYEIVTVPMTGEIFEITDNGEIHQKDGIFDSILYSFAFIDYKTSLDTSTWQTYENKELEFSFKYPSEFGKFSFEIGQPNEDTTGKYIIATFSDQPGIKFGGETKNFSQGRGGHFLDIITWIKEGDKYYHVLPGNKRWLIEPIKILGANGQILVVDKYSYVAERGLTDGPVVNPGAGLGALIKLNNKEFKGLAVLNRTVTAGSLAVSATQFEQILSTFQFTP